MRYVLALLALAAVLAAAGCGGSREEESSRGANASLRISFAKEKWSGRFWESAHRVPGDG